MKLKRRGFLGAIGGAAALGPQRAATAVLQANPPMTPSPGYISGTAGECASSSAVDYLTRLQGDVARMEALRLVGMPNGLLRHFSEQWGPSTFTQDIDGLISVSPAIKARWVQEAVARRQLEDWEDRPRRVLARELLRRATGFDL